MQETDETVANIFTKGSHHRNISVVFLAQNRFPQTKFPRTMSLNADYMVLFKNPRDASQFANPARQMYPKTSKFAVEAYEAYIYSSTFDRSRTKICVCEPLYFRERNITCTCRNEFSREEVPTSVETATRIHQKSDSEFVHYVSECAQNVIKSNVSLISRQKANLRRSKNDLRALCSKKTSLQQKRTILKRGGFLSVLPPLLGILGTFMLK